MEHQPLYSQEQYTEQGVISSNKNAVISSQKQNRDCITCNG